VPEEVLVDGPGVVEGETRLLRMLENGLDGSTQAITYTLAVVAAEEVVVDSLQHDLHPCHGEQEDGLQEVG